MEKQPVRPIDANAIVNYHVTCTNGKEYVLLPVKTLAEYPTLDYAPVRHGEWVEKIEPYAYTAAGREIHIFHCSACDFTWANKRMVFDYFKHCPNCGAKMDGGKQ